MLTSLRYSSALLVASLALFSSCSGNAGEVKHEQEVNSSVEPRKTDFIHAKIPFNKDLQLYELDVTLDEEREVVRSIYVSLSDNYQLSENPDSLAIPLNGDETDTLESICLKGKYRKQFLYKLGLKEDDTMFLYDYGNDLFLTFPVKTLKTIAWLSPYEGINDRPYGVHSYMIGFELDKRLGKRFSYIYGTEVLITFGKKSPFERGKMKLMTWQKQAKSKWPTSKSKLKQNYFKGFESDSPVVSKYDTLTYWVQDWVHKKDAWNEQRHLMVIGKSGALIYETVFITDEAVALNGLNSELGEYTIRDQWVGMLFKGGGQTFTGFTGNQFGCQYFTVLNKPVDYIYIKCDNRH